MILSSIRESLYRRHHATLFPRLKLSNKRHFITAKILLEQIIKFKNVFNTLHIFFIVKKFIYIY